MAPELPDAGTLIGTVALTGTGERLGLVVDAHPRAGTPRWAWVRTGIVETDVSLLPLAGAWFSHDTLVVTSTAAQVEGAPRHPLGSALTPADEEALHDHYGTPAADRVVPDADAPSGDPGELLGDPGELVGDPGELVGDPAEPAGEPAEPLTPADPAGPDAPAGRHRAGVEEPVEQPVETVETVQPVEEPLVQRVEEPVEQPVQEAGAPAAPATPTPSPEPRPEPRPDTTAPRGTAPAGDRSGSLLGKVRAFLRGRAG
ncbi:outer membrane biosynthesis protein TonB [Kineococcus radiotolerans]|uniref:Outer membrane biosynthesis protein TonB n=1 Tax=Kineococcus radiotolerans TaxID=131568 RepID=A0A7W4TLX6_KINRA|nr:hypothetical protein [Kineococcus radiotolerans]MBB2901312.1 outer membrane biosynthesis protein TonB [Kineococcus radiotolerans]